MYIRKKPPPSPQNKKKSTETFKTLKPLNFLQSITLVSILSISIVHSVYTFLSPVCSWLSCNGSHCHISIAQFTGHCFIKAIIFIKNNSSYSQTLTFISFISICMVVFINNLLFLDSFFVFVSCTIAAPPPKKATIVVNTAPWTKLIFFYINFYVFSL